MFCFAITSLPVILLGIFSYAHSSGVVQNNVNAQKALSLAQIQTNIEQVLKTVDQSATHFLSSHMVRSALNEPLHPTQFTLVNQLKSELNFLQRLDTGISDITLLSTAGQWMMDNRGLYRLDDAELTRTYADFMQDPAVSHWEIRVSEEDETLPDQSGSLGEAGAAAGPGREEDVRSGAEESGQAIPGTGRAAGTATRYAEGANTGGCAQQLQLIKKLPLTAFQPIGLAVITIPACTLGEKLSFDASQEALLILDDRQQQVWTQGLAIRDTETIGQSLAMRSAPASQLSLALDGQEHIVTYRKSDYNGWTYISVIPQAHLNEQSHGIGWYTLWICLALLALFIVLSWMWSKRMYRPIDLLYRDVVGTAEGQPPVRGGDELSAIGEKVNTLFRTQRELKHQLHGHLEQLKTFFMIKMVLGGIKEEEIVEGLDTFDMRHDFRSFGVMSARIELENTRFESKDYDLLMFAVNNMIAELLPEEKRLQPILISRTQVTVVTSDSDGAEPFRQELFSLAKRVQDKVDEYLGIPVYIGVSLTYRKLTEIPRAYEESLEALRAQKRFGGQTILDFADLGENHTLQYAYPIALQTELIDAIKLVDKERTELLVGQFVGEISSNASSPHDQQFHAVRLLMNLLNVAHSYEVQALTMSRQQSLFDELFQLDIGSDGERWLLQMLVEPILAGIEERTENRHLQVSRELVQIIHNEFETDLSIELCAERLHYNPSYLSTVFRKSMNVPFSTYLAQHRLQVAKKWLVETDMSVKEISERLRYNNPQNFIRSFRKQEGVPPGKYRELQTGEQRDGTSTAEGE